MIVQSPPLGTNAAPIHLDSDVQQRYRGLLRRLGWPSSGESTAIQALGITSSSHGEGVTTIAAQLAVTAAEMSGRSVLLVDAHFARPAIARRFGLSAVPGLADALSGKVEGLPIYASAVTNLSILTAGSASEKPETIYDAAELSSVVQELRADFDLVIFDLPPIDASHAPLRLAEMLDTVLLVVVAEGIRWQHARRVRDLLAHAKVPVAGAVLNQPRRHAPDWLYPAL